MPGTDVIGSEQPVRRGSVAFQEWLSPQHLALLVTTMILIWSYLPNLVDLSETWSNDSNYTHGYLVIPIALAIFWSRPNVGGKSTPSTFSLVVSSALLVLLLGFRTLMYEWSNQWLETVTLIPAVACLVWIYGGRPLLMRAWPAILFLIFLLPLPRNLNNLVSLPLQRLATMGSGFVLQLTGIWAIPEGNVINLNTGKGLERLEVATVCNGLSMLMSLAAVVMATIAMTPMPLWKRLVFLASVLPIALFSNILRIVVTGWGYYLFGGEHTRKLAHDWAGFLMMPVALGLVFIEMLVLSWLAEPDQEVQDNASKNFLSAMTARKS